MIFVQHTACSAQWKYDAMSWKLLLFREAYAAVTAQTVR